MYRSSELTTELASVMGASPWVYRNRRESLLIGLALAGPWARAATPQPFTLHLAALMALSGRPSETLARPTAVMFLMESTGRL